MSGNGLGVGSSSMRRSSSQSQKMDKLQPRMSSAFPPPHKTQLPPRFQVNQGPWRGRSSSRRNTWVFLGSLLLISFFLYLISISKGIPHFQRRVGNNKGYAVIIDGGSTGSRLHVFQYIKEGSIPFLMLKGKESFSLKTRPGLSSFASSPEAAGTSLAKLLDFAKANVPQKFRTATPLYLMATAGLRLLDKDVQEAILSSCRNKLRAAGFMFKDEWASVITGTDEGIYAWVAANYALGTLGGDPQETTGVVELGGASAQVTFVPESVPPPAFRHELFLGGITYTLYTYSFLHFGQEAAWEKLLHMITSGVLKMTPTEFNDGDEVVDPCTPRGYIFKRNSLISEVTNDKSVKDAIPTIRAAGNFSECRRAALALFQKGQDGCLYKKCAIGAAFVPELRGKFFATENFYYTSEFFGLPSTTSLAEMERAGQHFCGEDWDTLQQKHQGMETEDLLKYCFSTAYIVALLHDTLGVDMRDDRFRFTNRVGEVPLDWALGALIVHLENDSFGEMPPVWYFGEGAFRVFAVIGCIVILSFAVWMIMRIRRPHVKTIYDLEKGRYFTTAARGGR
ncbi:hypothetical protein R1sor_003932 [Riccia sorocarpa]|uniref:Apyrase n=1 Tax=Riccia sorocarpa TaxID=122646 RepID=A0ABD3H6K0_9MARC